MKRQRQIYKYLYILAILAAGLITFLDIHSIEIKESKNPYNFSATRVAEDIKIISKKPHSIEHPTERKVVRDYLEYRLQHLNGNVQIFEYDSIKARTGGYIKIANIYAEFYPPEVTDSTSYILLVAHYDSRFAQKVISDTVYSFGAADDGYGLGVALELVRVANNYHNLWRQGIKVLFTDAEENEMDGMANMILTDSYLMHGVNLVINLEARGVRGPALLFETSPNNSKLVDFYKISQRPYGYSLTSVIYNILPNDTDFSLIKNSIPGYNFAVVDNLKYYHTEKDNYNNISLKSIQHYGEQINPLVKSYLIGQKFGAEDYFNSESGSIFFTLPSLGLFSFSKGEYILLNILTLVLLSLVLFVLYKRDKLDLRKVKREVVGYLLVMLAFLAAGLSISYLISVITGEEFNLLSIRYFIHDNMLYVAMLLLVLLTMILFSREKSIASPLLIFALFTIISLIIFLDNFIFLLPLLLSAAASLLFYLFRWRFAYLISAFLIALLGFSFYYLLYVTVTIGSLGFLLFLATPYIGILVAQYRIICVSLQNL